MEVFAASLDGLRQIVVWPTIGFMLAGTALGLVVGLLPGLGGPAALALMLPLVFPLDSVDAFSLLTGAAAVTVTAGDITSILLGVPGEATSAAVVADGHALAKRGEGGRAAGAAVTAAFIGALIGAIALAVTVPVARPLLSRIASPELAVLSLLGICLVIPLSTGGLVKGLIAGGLGLLLATVGLDPSMGTPRFTFGQLFLWDGIGLLPAALGLFAVPEVIALMSGGAGTHADVQPSSGAMGGVREAVARWRLVLRCSLIGTGIGVLPAAGASVSQWVAYAHAAQSSSRRTSFGTGEIDGVIGPAAASNATFGGALVPTLALGIPGSLSTALLLAALVLKGIAPGPSFLIPASEGGHLTLLFSFVWLIVLSNLVAALAILLLLDKLVLLSRVRAALLVPVVLTMILVGAFAEKNAPGDLGIAVAMGGLGWAMVRFDWPRAPLLLGLVLGALFERRLFLAASAYGWTWVARPGALVLTAGLVYLLARGLRRGMAFTAERPGATNARGDLLFSGAIILLLLAATATSLDLTGRPAALPRILIVVTLGLASLQAAVSIRAARASQGPATRAPLSAAMSRSGFGWLLLFAVNAWALGFAAGTALSGVLYMRWAHRESWTTSVTLAGALTLCVHLLLDRMLHAPAFGLLPDLLGGRL